MNAVRKKALAKIAYQYYIDGRSQNELAKELNVDRTTISRMLKEARETKIVSIEIDGYDKNVLELESYLKHTFKLKNVIISYSTEMDSAKNKNLSFYTEAANYIQKVIKNGDNVGLSWGKTISEVISQIGTRQTRDITFIPLAGGPSSININYHVNTIVHEMGHKFGGDSKYINMQVVQEKNVDKQKLLASENINELFSYWNNLDVAVVGIGGTLRQKSKWRDVLSHDDFEELKLREAVGDCCCQFFDSEGKILKGKLYHRTISIPLEKLASVNYSIGIAVNKNKAKAILAMLKQKYINVLITDYETALEIARLTQKNN